MPEKKEQCRRRSVKFTEEVHVQGEGTQPMKEDDEEQLQRFEVLPTQSTQAAGKRYQDLTQYYSHSAEYLEFSGTPTLPQFFQTAAAADEPEEEIRLGIRTPSQQDFDGLRSRLEGTFACLDLPEHNGAGGGAPGAAAVGAVAGDFMDGYGDNVNNVDNVDSLIAKTRAVNKTSQRVPGYLQDNKRYTHYTCDDVQEEMNDHNNARIAMAFLHNLSTNAPDGTSLQDTTYDDPTATAANGGGSITIGRRKIRNRSNRTVGNSDSETETATVEGKDGEDSRMDAEATSTEGKRDKKVKKGKKKQVALSHLMREDSD